MRNGRKDRQVELAKRRFLNAQEATLFLGLVVICLFLLVLQPMLAEPGAMAVVSLDSEEIMRVSLREDDNYRIDLLEEYGIPVSFEVKGGGIRYVDVVCPDHICEKTGVISAEGQTAVCMPNRVAVVILEPA